MTEERERILSENGAENFKMAERTSMLRQLCLAEHFGNGLGSSTNDRTDFGKQKIQNSGFIQSYGDV